VVASGLVPVYEYRCISCGKIFEYMQRITEPPLTACEECAGELERLISATSFHLKGSGWYKDLYSSSKKDSGAPASGEGGAAKETAAPEKTAGGEAKAGSGSGTGTGTGTGTGAGSAGKKKE
jgi:putative FmdB family regulatory protein